MENREIWLKVYELQDRLDVATILIKNGYSVKQVKQKRNQTGKAVDYFLVVVAGEEAASE